MSQRVVVGMFACAVAALGWTLSASAQGEKKALSDAEFVKKAASSGLHEVELGRIAQRNAQSAEVKKFGQMMEKDHSKANEELKQVAQTAGLQVPAMMMPKHQKEVEKFMNLKGGDFDREYMSHMVSSHEKGKAMFQQASTQAQNGAIKAFAAKTLPVIEHHLQHANQIKQQVGGK